MTTEWVTQWNDVISAEAEMPGVWRRKAGGFRVRGRVVDPKTGKLRGVNRIVECTKAREAAAVLQSELDAIRAGVVQQTSSRPNLAEWSLTVFERKVKSGAIASATGRDKWAGILKDHIIPALGPIFVDKLTREDVERWKSELLSVRVHTKGDEKRRRKLTKGRYEPTTVNTILGVLRQITKEASQEFNIADAALTVENASTRGHRTHTYEEPNSVKPEDVPRFLTEVRCSFPQHYAFVLIGFTTGLRPSSLRPLRRRGPQSDVKWDEGKLLVRRSHTKGAEVMDSTKTDADQVLALDPEQLSVLRWHADRLDRHADKLAEKPETLAIAEAMRASDLLFPSAPTRWSKGGGFRSRSVLDKVFEVVGTRLELGYPVSPKAMRRTFNDLSRAAKNSDVVTRSISGHATESMQRRYSTVATEEQREAMGNVVDIATARKRRAA